MWKMLRPSFTRAFNFMKADQPGVLVPKRPISKTQKLLGDSKEDLEAMKSNPFFDKYAEKLAKMRGENPAEFQSKIESLQKKQKEEHDKKKKEVKDAIAHAKDAIGKPKKLEDKMKLDLIKDKSTEEITEIWMEYHHKKNCVYGVVQSVDYNFILDRVRSCPRMLFPLKRGDGHELYLAETAHGGKEWYFTPLLLWQLHKENAPHCLHLVHYPELAEAKNIVLFAGEHDPNIISVTHAQALTQQMALFYGRNSGDRYLLVTKFNHTPEKFNYTDLFYEHDEMLKWGLVVKTK